MKKPIAQLIAEHNAASQDAELRYEEVRDAVILQLTRVQEARRLFLTFEMRLFDQATKFQEELDKLLEHFKQQ